MGVEWLSWWCGVAKWEVFFWLGHRCDMAKLVVWRSLVGMCYCLSHWCDMAKLAVRHSKIVGVAWLSLWLCMGVA